MIKGVIFDLSGTIIDKYSLSSLINLRKAFLRKRIDLYPNMLIKDLDKKKLNHIYAISNTYQFKSQFLHNHGSPAYDNDLLEIYDDFCSLQQLSLKSNVDIIPGAEDTLKMLKDRNIKIGITSNSINREHMDLCINILKRYGIQIDSAVSTSCLTKVMGTNSDMIKLNMKQMDIDDPKHILRVDDMCSGIEGGNNIGCLTVAVPRWSSSMGVHSYKCLEELEEPENFNKLRGKLIMSRDILYNSNPYYMINDLKLLEQCLEPNNLLII
jgi:phosphonoacetaldehyde hydrolase